MTTELFTGRASEGGHWYEKDGTPAYELIGKNGNRRPVTLRDARKLNLLPGFSTIARLEYKPALEQWKINQALMAALTLPHIDGETLDAFKARAALDAEAQSDQARDRGTQLHAAMEAFFLHPDARAVPPEHLPYVVPVAEWLTNRFPGVRWQAERTFGCAAGYGGKVDLYAREVAVVDFKFKDFSDPKAVKGYDEHEMQLHAYAHGLGDPLVAKVNLFVSSTVPGLIVPVEWPHNPAAYEAFTCLLRLWQIRKGYAP